MKVVLRKDQENLGEVDDVVNVADGHARNFLFPRRLAALATKTELAAVEKRSVEKLKRITAKKAEAEALAKRLSELEVVIFADVGEAGKLFGSVTAADIAQTVKTLSNIELDKKKISLKEPIKQVGSYTVNVKIYKDVTAALKVAVEKKAADKEAAEKEADKEPAA